MAGMAEALLGAMEHSASLAATKDAAGRQLHGEVLEFTKTLRTALHNTFRYGQGTRDMAGPDGLTTEQVRARVRFSFSGIRKRQRTSLPDPT